MSRPSLKRYISLNDQDEYKRRICTADDDDVNEATGRDETVRASETESCTLNKVDNNVIYDKGEIPGRQPKNNYSVSGQHQYHNGNFLESTDHDSPHDDDGNTAIEGPENIFGKRFNKLSVSWRRNQWFIAVVIMLVIFAIGIIVVYFITKSNSNSNDYPKESSKIFAGSSIKDQCLLYEEPGHYDRQSNPLRDRCQNGSKFVTTYCGLGGGVSKHSCLECPHGDFLPNFCFCDVGHQCRQRVDAPTKQTCSWCKHNCPCLNKGMCSCVKPNTTGEHIRCSCPTGYGGRYCEVVPVRLCKTAHKSKYLAHCAESSNEECYIYYGIGKSNMTCTIYTDGSVETSIPNCTEVTTPGLL